MGNKKVGAFAEGSNVASMGTNTNCGTVKSKSNMFPESGPRSFLMGSDGRDDDDGAVHCANGSIFSTLSNTKQLNWEVKVSFFEIRNESIVDLLNTSNVNLEVLMDPHNRPFVRGLTLESAMSSDQVKQLLKRGVLAAERNFGDNSMNKQSLRTHSIVQLHLKSYKVQTTNERDSQSRSSILNIVDLDTDTFLTPYATPELEVGPNDEWRCMPSMFLQVTSVQQDEFTVQLLSSSVCGKTRKYKVREIGGGDVNEQVNVKKQQKTASVDVEIENDHGTEYKLAVFDLENGDDPLSNSTTIRFEIIKDADQRPPSNTEYKPEPIDITTVLKVKDDAQNSVLVFWSLPSRSFGKIAYRILIGDDAQTIDKLPYTLTTSFIPTSFRVVTVATVEDENYVSAASELIYVGCQCVDQENKEAEHAAVWDDMPDFYLQIISINEDEFVVHLQSLMRTSEKSQKFTIREICGSDEINEQITIKKKQNVSSVEVEFEDDHDALYTLGLFDRQNGINPLPNCNQIIFEAVKRIDTKYKPQPIDLASVTKAKDNTSGMVSVFWSLPRLTYGAISYKVLMNDTDDAQVVDVLPYTFQLSVIPLSFRVVTVASFGGEQHESLPSHRISVGCEKADNITKSLDTLGLVVKKLSDNLKKSSSAESSKLHHMAVPYRDSKLTHILKSSLGAKSDTVVICTMSPADEATLIRRQQATIGDPKAGGADSNMALHSANIDTRTEQSADSDEDIDMARIDKTHGQRSLLQHPMPDFFMQVITVRDEEFMVRVDCLQPLEKRQKLEIREPSKVRGFVNETFHIKKRALCAQIEIDIEQEHDPHYSLTLFAIGDTDPLTSIPVTVFTGGIDEYKPLPIDIETAFQAFDSDKDMINVYWSVPALSYGDISYKIIYESGAGDESSRIINVLPYKFEFNKNQTSFRVVTIATSQSREFESEPSAIITLHSPERETQPMAAKQCPIESEIPCFFMQVVAVGKHEFLVRVDCSQTSEKRQKFEIRESSTVRGFICESLHIKKCERFTLLEVDIEDDHDPQYGLVLFLKNSKIALTSPLRFELLAGIDADYFMISQHKPQPVDVDTVFAAFSDENKTDVCVFWSTPPALFGVISYRISFEDAACGADIIIGQQPLVLALSEERTCVLFRIITICSLNKDDSEIVHSISSEPILISSSCCVQQQQQSQLHVQGPVTVPVPVSKAKKRPKRTRHEAIELSAGSVQPVQPNVIDFANDDTGGLSYPALLDLKMVMSFGEMQLIDYRDFNARYLSAKIMKISFDTNRECWKFGVHYEGWDDKWNVWSTPKFQFQRYAHHGSVSMRGLHRQEMRYVSLKRPYGDYIEVKPLHLYFHSLYKLKHQRKACKVDGSYVHKYKEWHVAEVCLKDRFSAQVQVVLLRQNELGEWFKPLPKADLYWVHLDNEQECAPKNTHIVDGVISIEGLHMKQSQGQVLTGSDKVQASGQGPEQTTLKVVIRVRTLSKLQLKKMGSLDVWDIDVFKSVMVRLNSDGANSGKKSFYHFDRIYTPRSNTQDIYTESLEHVVSAFLNGDNGNIFAYGPTCSGKTYTLMGVDGCEDGGSIHYAVDSIFSTLSNTKQHKWELNVSFFEIQNESIVDLLKTSNANLEVFHHPFVRGLTLQSAMSSDQVKQLLKRAVTHHNFERNSTNKQSSRSSSHTVFQLHLKMQTTNECDSQPRFSILSIVDLAGSESVISHGGHAKGGNISKSLNTLGLVIKLLSANSQKSSAHSTKLHHMRIPYRNSKLTHVLEFSLGANSNTIIICTMSPADVHADETESTLVFAARLKDNKVADDEATICNQKDGGAEKMVVCAQDAVDGDAITKQSVDTSTIPVALPKFKHMASMLKAEGDHMRPVQYGEMLDDLNQYTSRQEERRSKTKCEPATEAKKALQKLMAGKNVFPTHSKKLAFDSIFKK